MKVPCGECLVKVRCMQKVRHLTYDKYNTNYEFAELLKECSQLREYFEINTPYHMVRMKRGHYLTLWALLHENPRGDQLIESFLKTMHIKKMPTKNFPVKKGGVKRAIKNPM